jgi:hypothetical protein
MGNATQKIQDDTICILDNIFKMNCSILDIGERKGHTGYIDFIHLFSFKTPILNEYIINNSS